MKASDRGWQVMLTVQRARNQEEAWGEWGLGKKTARLKKKVTHLKEKKTRKVVQVRDARGPLCDTYKVDLRRASLAIFIFNNGGG